MIQVSVADRRGLRTFSFASEAVVVGSSYDADVMLEHPGVAPKHIRIGRRDRRLYVDDLRGNEPSRPVAPSDRIRIAGIDLWARLYALAPEGVVDPVERRLLDELRHAPGDGELRAVYADWLEDHGHTARAEFLRTQLAVAGTSGPTSPAFERGAARLAELAPEVGEGWRARVAMTFIERCPVTRRGARELGFELVCPMRWDQLTPTADDGIRRCHACHREVTYCTSIEQARPIAEDGGCIALDAGTDRDGLTGPMMVGRPSPPISRYGRMAIARRDGVVR